MSGFIYRPTFGDVAKENIVRAREGQKHLARRWSASGSMYDANLLIL